MSIQVEHLDKDFRIVLLFHLKALIRKSLLEKYMLKLVLHFKFFKNTNIFRVKNLIGSVLDFLDCFEFCFRKLLKKSKRYISKN